MCYHCTMRHMYSVCITLARKTTVVLVRGKLADFLRCINLNFRSQRSQYDSQAIHSNPVPFDKNITTLSLAGFQPEIFVREWTKIDFARVVEITCNLRGFGAMARAIFL